MKTLKIIFNISFIYYLFWLIYAIVLCITGIDHGWVMPAMSDGTLMYGFDAFKSGIVIGAMITIKYLWIVPLYQIFYLIFKLVYRKKKNK